MRADPVQIAGGAAGNEALLECFERRIKYWNFPELDYRVYTRGAAHLIKVPQQSEAGHIGGCPCAGCKSSLCRFRVQAGHRLDGLIVHYSGLLMHVIE